MEGRDDADALAALSRPPAPPREPGRFSADSPAGPGIYPQGPPMRPAAGPPWDAARARAAVAASVPDAADRERALAAFADPALARRVAGPGPRAALAILTGTAGEPLVAAVAEGRAPAIGSGPLAEASRVIGPDPADPGRRLVNDRYRAEHPALVAPSLVHALLAGPPPRGHAQEALLHGLLAAVHLQIVARAPRLAGLGTELARRQNSLALSLFNSRPAGLAVDPADRPGRAGHDPGRRPRHADARLLEHPLRAARARVGARAGAAAGGPAPADRGGPRPRRPAGLRRGAGADRSTPIWTAARCLRPSAPAPAGR